MSRLRECRWCAVRLRWWQIGFCDLCHAPFTGDAGIYLQSGGPPVSQGSRKGQTQ
jgi:hypothetical protein